MSFQAKAYAIAVVTISFLATGCQDYGFEDLKWSVIEPARVTYQIELASAVDILFVVDNSGSMVGEQKAIGMSFSKFSGQLDKYFGPGMYRIAVITTGIESDQCKPCSATTLGSCTNETGESGRFQYRLGWNIGTADAPNYMFEEDPTCKIITSENADRCFFQDEKGVILVGVNGCGFERGLESMRKALSEPLLGGWNANFLRDDADLVVVVITDEEDCGKVGEITEGLPGIQGKSCYYAAKGSGPTGSQSDSTGKTYSLTPVSEYYDFLVNLKGDKKKVKIATIVGVDDVDSPTETEILYENSVNENAGILATCFTEECQGQHCTAKPGTRYIELAEMVGIGDRAFVDEICKADFSMTMQELGSFVGCPTEFKLREPIVDPGLIGILVNDVSIPIYTCQNADRLEVCTGPDDNTCSNQNVCERTWNYVPPEDNAGIAYGGKIVFADHYDPCVLIDSKTIKIELVYSSE